MKEQLNDIRLSPHFTLGEFLNLGKYPENIPPMQVVANLTYGCHLLLEPAREAIGCPVLINSGYRSEAVNQKVGGVPNSQHKIGQAADIRPRDPVQFQRLVEFSVRRNGYVRATHIGRSDLGTLITGVKLYRKIHPDEE